MAVYAVVLYAVFYGILLQKKLLRRMKLPYRRLKVSGILLSLIHIFVERMRLELITSTLPVSRSSQMS